MDSICTEFLVSDYRLNRDQAEQLVGEMMHAAREIQKNSEKILDETFLKYIFVTAAVSESESHLIECLGIGRDLIARLKSAVKSIQIEGDTDIKFLPEVDAKFAEIIVKNAKEMKARPWVNDLYFLEYELDSANDILAMQIEDYGSQWIFDLLKNLCINNESNADSMLKNNTEYCIANRLPPIEEGEFYASLEELAKLGFIFRMGSGAKGPIFQPSEKSQKLTAEAYAFDMNKAPTVNGLKDLNKYYQKAVIQKLKGKRAHIGLDLLKKIPYPLNPMTLPKLVKNLRVDIGDDRLIELMAKHLESTFPWVRKSVCSALEVLITNEKASDILVQVAKSDNSESVREFALSLLSKDLSPAKTQTWSRVLTAHENANRN